MIKHNTVEQELVLYGAGQRCLRLVELVERYNILVKIHIVDSSPNVIGSKIGCFSVESPDILLSHDNLIICITTAYQNAREEIREKMKHYSEMVVEISYFDVIFYLYANAVEFWNKISLIREKNRMVEKSWSTIFISSQGLGLGGIEEWSKSICMEFIKNAKDQTYILTRSGDYNIPKELEGHILDIDIQLKNSFSVDDIEQTMISIVSYMPCVLVSSQPDVVLIASKLLRKFQPESIRVISVLHGDHEDIYQSYLEMDDYTDLYIGVSTDIEKNMIKKGIDKKRILSMMCPVYYSQNLERTYSVDYYKPIKLGYAGRISKLQKRMDLFIQLLEELERWGIPYYLELAGDGDYKAEIQTYVERNHLSHKIKLLGKIHRDDIPVFWMDKDICINIADYEGRSLSIVEAMAQGVVPIVTNTSGVSDDIVCGENGFVVELGDYKKMAQYIKYLSENRELLPTMGNLAYMELAEKSDMQKHYEYWKNTIEYVLELRGWYNE